MPQTQSNAELRAELELAHAALAQSQAAYLQQSEESLDYQLQLEQQQQHSRDLQTQLTTQQQGLQEQCETWKQRALTAENRLLEYAPLDRQLLDTQQQLAQLQQTSATDQRNYEKAQERILALERHILQLKVILDKNPPPPPKPMSLQVGVHLPSFKK